MSYHDPILFEGEVAIENEAYVVFPRSDMAFSHAKREMYLGLVDNLLRDMWEIQLEIVFLECLCLALAKTRDHVKKSP